MLENISIGVIGSILATLIIAVISYVVRIFFKHRETSTLEFKDAIFVEGRESVERNIKLQSKNEDIKITISQICTLKPRTIRHDALFYALLGDDFYLKLTVYIFSITISISIIGFALGLIFEYQVIAAFFGFIMVLSMIVLMLFFISYTEKSFKQHGVIVSPNGIANGAWFEVIDDSSDIVLGYTRIESVLGKPFRGMIFLRGKEKDHPIGYFSYLSFLYLSEKSLQKQSKEFQTEIRNVFDAIKNIEQRIDCKTEVQKY